MKIFSRGLRSCNMYQNTFAFIYFYIPKKQRIFFGKFGIYK